MMKRMPRRSPMTLNLQQQWRNDDARTQASNAPATAATARPKRQRKHPRAA